MAWAAIIAVAVVGGLPGPLSLLMLVPVASIILPFYVAFTEWPALRNGGGRSHR